MKIKFNTPTDRETHVCESYRNGEWIIFKCPKCPDYEQRLNWQTGKIKTKNSTNEVYHTGSYAPIEFLEILRDVN